MLFWISYPMKQSKNEILATQEVLKIILVMFPNEIHPEKSSSGKDTSCGQEQLFSKLPN